MRWQLWWRSAAAADSKARGWAPSSLAREVAAVYTQLSRGNSMTKFAAAGRLAASLPLHRKTTPNAAACKTAATPVPHCRQPSPWPCASAKHHRWNSPRVPRFLALPLASRKCSSPCIPTRTHSRCGRAGALEGGRDSQDSRDAGPDAGGRPAKAGDQATAQQSAGLSSPRLHPCCKGAQRLVPPRCTTLHPAPPCPAPARSPIPCRRRSASRSAPSGG